MDEFPQTASCAVFRAFVERAFMSRKLYDIATDTTRDMTEAEVIATRSWLEGMPHAQ